MNAPLHDLPDLTRNLDNHLAAGTGPGRTERAPLRKTLRRSLAALGLAALTGLCNAAAPLGTPRPVTPRGPLAADERATIDLFETAKPSVVFITTAALVRDLLSRDVYAVPRGSGSGFIWDDAGHVVTNYHVIEDASRARVKLADGRDYAARLVGASAAHDLAVLKIDLDATRPPPLPIGTSHDLRVGQKVLAIGNPFGLDWTLTTGIISALDRSLGGGGKGPTVEHLIQTDAAINPGNSGGPLLDSAGRLIGINTAIYSPSGASAGIGFAVPVDTVNRVVPQLIAHGKYTRPSLGIQIDDALNRRLAAALDVRGVIVLGVVPGSPAARAGLQPAQVRGGRIVPGDILVAVDGEPVDSVARLNARLDDREVGARITLDVLRNGRTLRLNARLDAGS